MKAKTFQDFRRLFPKNLWQSMEWAQLQIDLGKEVIFIGDDECMTLAIVQTLPFGFSYLEFPRGPLGNTDITFWDEVKKRATEYSCVFTRISPFHRVQNLPKLSFQSDLQMFPQDTLLIDLSLSEEEILKHMKPKGRYNIRIAQRNKVEVFESTNVEDFYNLLQETTQRDGFSGHSLSYYENFLKSLGENAKLYLASIIDKDTEEKIIVAGGIFTFLDDTCVYYYGASTSNKKYRNLMAPYLVQWFAINEARKKEMKHYDFLGIAPENAKNHSLSGVTQFKKQFGGEHVSYPEAKDIIYRPFFYGLFRLWKLLRRIW